MIVDDGLGYRIVHDEIAEELKHALIARTGLYKFICLQLAQLFMDTNRYSSAFQLYKDFDPKKALASAQKAASQLSIEGVIAGSVPALEFIVQHSRENGDRFSLAFNLIGLAQANDVAGNSSKAKINLSEAHDTAKAIGDENLIQVVEDQVLIHRIRHGLQPKDLAELRDIRGRYKSQGRQEDAARLALEEAVILININDYENAVPVLREAYTLFEEAGDEYGSYLCPVI